ncbi:unnamed protein product [Ostreobium quekettii]|uniref:RRM domain-containing protein n=1 Tax=Ostreobium quekettii TaxID=121088 RepID=A0A8S1IVG5_9CHLO|nr:unnamed protein product [Ostreobium quekettii]
MREDAGDRNARVCGEPKIFIGQIPMECSQEDVLALFRRFGNVKSASLMTHADGRSKGCAMVLYDKWSEAEAAMESTNGNACLGEDRALVVNFADPPKRGGGAPPIAPKTLFVGQVSSDPPPNALPRCQCCQCCGRLPCVRMSVCVGVRVKLLQPCTQCIPSREQRGCAGRMVGRRTAQALFVVGVCVRVCAGVCGCVRVWRACVCPYCSVSSRLHVR